MNKVVKNFVYNITGNIGSRLLLLVVLAFTTRAYGSEVFGQYNIALAEFSYFSMFAAMGTDSYGVYLVAKTADRAGRQKVVNDIVSVKIISGAIVAFVLFVYALLLPNSHRYTAVLSVLLVLQALDVSWVFNALQDMKISAYKSGILTVINTLFIVAFYYWGFKNVYGLLLARVFATTLTYFYILVELYRRHGFHLNLSRPSYFYYIREGAPYMVSGIFAGLNTNLDIIIMGYTVTASQTGYYSADYKLINEFVALCSVLFTTVYPLLIEKIAKNDVDYVNKLLGYLRTILLSLIIPFIILSFFYGREVLAIFFGQEYIAGFYPFVILMLFTGLLYYRELYGYVLTAAGKQPVYLRVVTISAIFNVVTNILFIPKFGISAAAMTTLGSEIINLFGMRYFARKYTNVKIQNYHLVKLIIPVAVTTGVMGILKYIGLHYIATIVICVAIYFYVYWKANVIEISLVKNLLHKN